jgi:hypothetical protein
MWSSDDPKKSRLIASQNTHQQVKAKIVERMGEWSEMFSKDPDLGVMEQAYMRLKTQSMATSEPVIGNFTNVSFRSEFAPAFETTENADHGRRPTA